MFRRRISSFFPPRDCREYSLFWGINNGNPTNVMAHEGPLVKVLYYLEYNLARIFRKLRALVKGVKKPAANFSMGKPIKVTPKECGAISE